MKRYRFPLAQVLRVRRIEEERAAADMAAARGDVELAGEAVDARISDLAGCGTPPSGTATGLFHWADRVRCAGGALTRATEHQGVSERKLAACRSRWNEAAMRVAALERLDERRRADHRRDALRDEMVAADELVAGRKHGTR